MTRRAGTSSIETKAQLLESAAKEFAQNGYQKASLRTICSDAGVTTGAMYFFFKNKEDLFESIIMPASEEIEGITAEIIGLEFTTLNEAGENDSYVNEYAHTIAQRIFDLANGNPQATKALVRNKDHDIVNRQRERLAVATKGSFLKTTKGPNGDKVEGKYNDDVADMLINIALDVIMHCIEAVSTGKADEKQIETVLCFMRGGLKAVADE